MLAYAKGSQKIGSPWLGELIMSHHFIPDAPPTAPAHLRLKDLARRFPLVFGDAVCKPLKKGIRNDIVAALNGQFSDKSVRRAIGFFTSSQRYLEAVQLGGPRYGLDGEPCGEVSAEESAHAARSLEAKKQSREDRWNRSRMVKKVEASGLSPRHYMQRERLDERTFQSNYAKGLNERAERRARRAALVASFDASGLTIEEFVERSRGRYRADKLARAIEKVRAMTPQAETGQARAEPT